MWGDRSSPERPAPLQRRLFGEVLVQEFGLPRQRLELALEEQRRGGGRLGEVLRRAGAIGPGVIPRALAVQARAVAASQAAAGGPTLPVRTFLSVCLPA